MEPLSIDVSVVPGSGTSRLMVLRGSVNDAGTILLQEEVARLRGETVDGIIVDMEGVDFISSAGMSVLVTLAGEVETAGGSVALVRVGPRVQAVFDMLGLNDFFRRFRSRDEAARAVARREPAAAPAAP
ncbi:MAG: STAS domain-containing protein, partial [Candidatus Brocadiae bacterium]|nr:STAS domain-containing protein [Candidatus Brocadiia bacterium]